MPLFNDLKDTMYSNLLTMGITSKEDRTQTVPQPYTMPDAETRLLRAKLIFEEAMETVKELDCYLHKTKDGFEIRQNKKCIKHIHLDMEGIIDGCCDTIYVCVGTLAAIGTYDFPHMRAVCDANNNKFPGGVAITANGKYQKPPGWKPPDHKAVQAKVIHAIKEKLLLSPADASDLLVKAFMAENKPSSK